MLTRRKETYLTATEAAKYLEIGRATFYRRYKDDLQEYRIGKRTRPYYKLLEVEQLNTVESAQVEELTGARPEAKLTASE